MNREDLLSAFGAERPATVGKCGLVVLMDVMGSDKDIADAARVSYRTGTKSIREDRALIRYLVQNHHTSPIEQAEIKLYIKCPIYIKNQIVRHRTASMNEASLRYSVAIDSTEWTDPDEWRTQDSLNKQGSNGSLELELGKAMSQQEEDLLERIRALYDLGIELGVAREQIRKILPLSQYTEFVWKIDAKNLLHFLHLRQDEHAQSEIREFAEAIGKIVEEWIPDTWNAFREFVIDAISLSEREQALLGLLIREGSVERFTATMTPSERAPYWERFEIHGLSERRVFVQKMRRLNGVH